MNAFRSVKVKIEGLHASNVLVKFLDKDVLQEMSPNELVRRVEEGTYELVD